MRNINEYLSTKVNIKNLGFDWPKIPCQHDIIDFLDKLGFEEIQFDYSHEDLYGLIKMIAFKSKRNNKRQYIVSDEFYRDEYRWIRFWFGGEVSNENPIFFVRVTKDGHFVQNIDSPICALENSEDRFKRIYEYDEFVDYVNNYLNKNINAINEDNQ